jgi:HK97 family phage major capsid protein
MPALGTNTLSMAFGDFREGYQIVDRIGLSVLRDPYTSYPYVFFKFRKRVGGGVVNFEAIKLLRFGS